MIERRRLAREVTSADVDSVDDTPELMKPVAKRRRFDVPWLLVGLGVVAAAGALFASITHEPAAEPIAVYPATTVTEPTSTQTGLDDWIAQTGAEVLVTYDAPDDDIFLVRPGISSSGTCISVGGSGPIGCSELMPMTTTVGVYGFTADAAIANSDEYPIGTKLRLLAYDDRLEVWLAE